MSKTYRHILVFIVLLIFLVSSTSCLGCISKNDFITLNVSNSLVKYSFEYSNYYRRDGPSVHDKDSAPAVYLSIIAPKKPIKLVLPNSNGKGIKTVSSNYVPGVRWI